MNKYDALISEFAEPVATPGASKYDALVGEFSPAPAPLPAPRPIAAGLATPAPIQGAPIRPVPVPGLANGPQFIPPTGAADLSGIVARAPEQPAERTDIPIGRSGAPTNVPAVFQPQGIQYTKKGTPGPAERALDAAMLQNAQAVNLYTGDLAGVAEVARQLDENRYQPSPEMDAFNRSNGRASWDAFKKAPIKIIAEITAQGIGSSVPSLVAGAVGAVGGPAGIAAGVGLGSASVEFSSQFLSGLTERGVDVRDANAMRTALADPAVFRDVVQKAAIKAGIVGSVDALTALISGGLGAKALGIGGRGAVTGVGRAAGKAVATPATSIAAANLTRGTVGRRIAQGLGAAAIEPVGGMTGEAASEVAIGKPIHVPSVVAEGIGEIIPGIATAGMGAASRTVTNRTAAEAAPTETVPRNMLDENMERGRVADPAMRKQLESALTMIRAERAAWAGRETPENAEAIAGLDRSIGNLESKLGIARTSAARAPEPPSPPPPDVPTPPPTPPSSAPSGESASVPFMITNDVRSRLGRLGWNRADVDAMTPERAQQIIAAKERKPKPAPPPPAVQEPVAPVTPTPTPGETSTTPETPAAAETRAFYFVNDDGSIGSREPPAGQIPGQFEFENRAAAENYAVRRGKVGPTPKKLEQVTPTISTEAPPVDVGATPVPEKVGAIAPKVTPTPAASEPVVPKTSEPVAKAVSGPLSPEEFLTQNEIVLTEDSRSVFRFNTIGILKSLNDPAALRNYIKAGTLVANTYDTPAVKQAGFAINRYLAYLFKNGFAENPTSRKQKPVAPPAASASVETAAPTTTPEPTGPASFGTVVPSGTRSRPWKIVNLEGDDVRGPSGKTLTFTTRGDAVKRRDALYAASQKKAPRPDVAPAAPKRVAKAPETPGVGTLVTPESTEAEPVEDVVADIPADTERIPETPPDAIRRKNARSIVEKSAARIAAMRKRPTPGETIPEPLTETEVLAYIERAGTTGSELITERNHLAPDAFEKVRAPVQEPAATPEGAAPAAGTPDAAEGTGESATAPVKPLRGKAKQEAIQQAARAKADETARQARESGGRVYDVPQWRLTVPGVRGEELVMSGYFLRHAGLVPDGANYWKVADETAQAEPEATTETASTGTPLTPYTPRLFRLNDAQIDKLRAEWEILKARLNTKSGERRKRISPEDARRETELKAISDELAAHRKTESSRAQGHHNRQLDKMGFAAGEPAILRKGSGRPYDISGVISIDEYGDVSIGGFRIAPKDLSRVEHYSESERSTDEQRDIEEEKQRIGPTERWRREYEARLRDELDIPDLEVPLVGSGHEVSIKKKYDDRVPDNWTLSYEGEYTYRYRTPEIDEYYRTIEAPAASGEQPAVQGTLGAVAGTPRGQRTARPDKRLPHEVLADRDATQTDVDIAVDEMTEPMPGDDSWTFTEPTPDYKGKRITRDDVKDVVADLMAAFGRRAVVRAGRVLPENAAQFDYRQWVARVRRQFNTLNDLFHEVAGHGVLAALNGRAGKGGVFGNLSRAARTEIDRLGYVRYGDYEHLDEGFAELMRYMLGAGDENAPVGSVATHAAREIEALLKDDPVVWREFERARETIGQYATQGSVNRTVGHIKPIGKAREVLKRAYRTGRRAALREENVFGKVRAVLAETSLADNWATSRASVKQMEREAEKIGGRAVRERVGEWELEQAIGPDDFAKFDEATKHNILLDLRNNPGWSRRSSVRTRVRKTLERNLTSAGIHPDIAATYADAITQMGRTPLSEKMKALNAVADGVVEQFILRGVYGADLVTNGPALMDALKLVRGHEQEFKAYLIAEHDLEIRRWNADGKLEPGDTGYVEPKLIEGDAETLVEHYRSSEFAEAAAIVWKWNKAANEYIIAHAPPEIQGFLRKVLGKWEQYVPYATELDPDTQRIMGRQARMGNPLKVLRGTHEMIYDPLAVMVANKIRLIEYAFNESAVYDAINLSQDVGGMGYWVEEVDPKFRLDSATIGKIAKQIEDITGVGIPEESRAEVVTFFTPLLRSSDTEPVYAKRMGRDIRLFYINPKLYESVYGMTRYRLPNGTPFATIIRAHAAVVRTQKAGTTAMRPVFTLVKAPFIDLPTAMHRTRGAGGAAAPITYLWYYMKAIGELGNHALGRPTPYLDLLTRMGTDISNAYGHDIRQAKGVPAMRSAGPARRAIRAINPLSWLKVWREAMGIEERSFRLAELMSVMKRLGIEPNADGTMPPVTEAQMVYLANAARHVINDWSDLGRATKAVNAHFKFFSVPAVVWRGTAEASREFPIRTVIMVAGLAALGAWLWDKNKDDPEYRNMTAAEKNLYWHWGPIRIRRDDVLGIPSMILETALARSYERAKGYPQWETEIADATKFIVGTTVPLVQPEGKFPWVEIPSGVQPIWDMATNWKSFFGVPIVPRGEVDLDPGYQRGPYTTRLAAYIGSTFDKKVFSARKLDYLLYAYFGGFGIDIIDATDAIAGLIGYSEFGLGSGRLRAKDWSGLPVVGALVRPAGGESKALDMLWGRIDDLSGIPTRERKPEQAGKLTYYELFARIASDYRDRMKDESLVASEKQALQNEMNGILEVALAHGGRFAIGKKTRWAIFNGFDLQAAAEIDRRRRDMQVAYVNQYLESHRGTEVDWDEMMAAFEQENAGDIRALENVKQQINATTRAALRDPDTSAANLEKYEEEIRAIYGEFQTATR